MLVQSLAGVLHSWGLGLTPDQRFPAEHAAPAGGAVPAQDADHAAPEDHVQHRAVPEAPVAYHAEHADHAEPAGLGGPVHLALPAGHAEHHAVPQKHGLQPMQSHLNAAGMDDHAQTGDQRSPLQIHLQHTIVHM